VGKSSKATIGSAGAGREADRRIERRLDGTSQDGGQAELITGVSAQRVGRRERIGDLVRQLRRETTTDVDRGQFLPLNLRLRLEFASLLIEVSALQHLAAS